MSNDDVEDQAIKVVLRIERELGREAQDVRHSGLPYDVSSPPRKIEVKAFGGSARGKQVPIEHRQAEEAREDPEHFYLYVVDNVLKGPTGIRVLHGASLVAVLNRAKPVMTYWPTLRTGEYDSIERLL
jgi:hypothetical protein